MTPTLPEPLWMPMASSSSLPEPARDFETQAMMIGMIEAREDADEHEEKDEHPERPGEGDEGHRGADAQAADEHEPPVFVAEGEADGEELNDERHEQAEVGEEPDLGIARDEELLAVENGEDHRGDDRGRVGQRVEERGGEEYSFFHILAVTKGLTLSLRHWRDKPDQVST